MPHAINPRVKNAILSILLEAKSCGVGKITRTALVKYVYLMDFWTAKETAGSTFTEIEWRFHHFGPYSEALVADLDFLSTQPSVQKEDISGKGIDYSLYSLGAWANAQTFESLNLAIDVRLQLVTAIKRYAMDLAGLLNFVYFETDPMFAVTPGATLSFEGLHKTNYRNDIKIVKVPIVGAQRIARIKSLLSDIANQWEEGHQLPDSEYPPIRDALFAQLIEDEGLVDAQGNHHATLSFRGDKAQ